ncbi:MAG TPA: hypothetical protein VMG12_27405, partial [Polyangiaceae bacterium]|nr:hypothetical protein [Polyangiaceae bacterium]
MEHRTLRPRCLLALIAGVVACGSSAPDADDADPSGDPGMTPSGPSACADGEVCGRDPNQGAGGTNVTTPGDGAPVFGDEVSNGGGVRLSDKIDLLFVVDNSVSMGDKQQIFSAAIPDLLERLVNPPCLNVDLTQTLQPATADEACPSGFRRQFAPLKDIHVGIVTSSLGAHGADNPIAGCAESDSDKGYMIGSLERGRGVPSYRDLGFLSWDPEHRVE